MKIIVVGCGKIGRVVVASLVNEKHNVIVIDNNPKVVSAMNNEYDVIGICGNATNHEKLLEAGAKNADLFIAMTSSDEINMLSCFTAKKLGAKHTIARIRATENNDGTNLEFMKRQLNLSAAVNPELLTAMLIFNIIKLPSASMVQTFSYHRFEMIELLLKENSPLDGVSLMDLRRHSKEKFLVCTVIRGDQVYIPQGDFRLKSGDKIGVIASGKETQKILKTMGIAHKHIRDALIIGGSETSVYLAKLLLDSHISVKIIEIDSQRCEQLCDELPGATIINGNGMTQDILLEEGINTTDAFVAITGRDEENILASYYATKQNSPKVITKVNSEERSYIAEKMGLESIITPSKITADAIVRYARALSNSSGGQVETLYRLGSGAEVIEFTVLQDFEYTNIPLKDLKLVPGILLAGIVREREAIIPSGNDVIKSGDKVIVVSAGNPLYDLGSIVEK